MKDRLKLANEMSVYLCFLLVIRNEVNFTLHLQSYYNTTCSTDVNKRMIFSNTVLY